MMDAPPITHSALVMYTSTIIAETPIVMPPGRLDNRRFLESVGRPTPPVARVRYREVERVADGVARLGGVSRFKSAVEVDVQCRGRTYRSKLFLSSGRIMIPGVIREDAADGLFVLRAVVDMGAAALGVPSVQRTPPHRVTLANFRTVLCLREGEHINTLELCDVLRDNARVHTVTYSGDRNRSLLFKITKSDIDPDSHWENIRARGQTPTPRTSTVIVYPSSKVNIQNGISPAFSLWALRLLVAVIEEHRGLVIVEQPRPADRED